jgi:hypothetical protein
MPQPLSRVLKNPTSLRFGPAAIESVPELARRIGLITTAYSFLEYQFGRTFAKLLEGKAGAAAAMFHALTSTSAQRGAMNAAAEVELSGEDLLIFRCIAAIASSIGKRRNPVVHGLTGFCPDLPDAILFTEDATMLAFHVKAENPVYELVGKLPALKVPFLDHNDILVYTAGDLDKLREDIIQARANFVVFWMMMDAKTQEERDQCRVELTTRPDVAAELAKRQRSG